MVLEDNFLEAIKKIRELDGKRNKERKFDQTIDLIVNLKEFDVRKNAFNEFVQISNKFKDKKIAGFFEKNFKDIKVIRKEEFGNYKEKKDIKKLIRSYDSFIANAKLMPAVATSFGRVLGPARKMPNPQLGIVASEDESVVQNVINNINTTVRIVVKEPSIKVGVAKASLDDNKIVVNIIEVYNKILEKLPKGKDNVKNVKIKFTMGKPVSVDIK